ncbi:MAG: SRPBCC domain-containing protein [Flavobacteriales bacterium]|nr:SRPBCC domain-containing protein [Flavobacteriales bacterium]
MSRPILHTAIFNAPIETVWDAITHFDNYGKWNEFCPKVDADFRVGGSITMYAKMFPNRKPTNQTERFFEITPPKKLRYGINYGILLKTDQTQILFALSNGKTQYHSALSITGMLAPFVLWQYRNAINRGFDLSLKGLRKYVEA